MPKNRAIYDSRDLEKASDEILKKVDRAVVAAAFKIRDEIRDDFRKDITKYKYATSNYYRMAEGIMVGKLRDGYVKIHALGSKENKGDWKARFFVGGTMVRKNSKGDKGLIDYNSAIDDGMKNANTILSTYVKNTLKN